MISLTHKMEDVAISAADVYDGEIPAAHDIGHREFAGITIIGEGIFEAPHSHVGDFAEGVVDHLVAHFFDLWNRYTDDFACEYFCEIFGHA